MGRVIPGTLPYCSRLTPTSAAVIGIAGTTCVGDEQLRTEPFANVLLCSGNVLHQSHCNAHGRAKYS
jgi:hypothetical protein